MLSKHFSRTEIEDFLFEEAALLDDWKLYEWLDLFTEDATYQVPATDLPRDSSPKNNLFYIVDDRGRLEARVVRLMKKTAFAEYPRSKTRRVVSNVRIEEAEEGRCKVSSVFVTYRSKMGWTDTFIGTSQYELVRRDGELKIVAKRSCLDLEALRPHGRISIIL
ncbi:MAG: aromatic-ring-hydroxylating dioxygenase subunit beta [Leeuwenhoekiella sp.]|nr:MAG: aromatic-ring-hydroxylating dioxygenase subunit beta [Leeuwenhoekiella sp.]